MIFNSAFGFSVLIPNGPSNVVVPDAFTFKMGTPDTSATLNRSPSKLSVTENSWPWVPCISNTTSPVVVPTTVNLALGD